MIRRICAEFIGTATLSAAVIGSGIMAAALTNVVGLQLLINAVSVVLALGVLIAVLGPVSGAHFNPAVSMIALVRREFRIAEGCAYIAVQICGAIVGAVVANVMFSLAPISISTHERISLGTLLGEVVATAGLLLVIGCLTRTNRASLGPLLVPAWIGAAYFFTASTSFANPAVTIGRALSDSFAGIAPSSVTPFIVAQLIGALVGAALTSLFFARPSDDNVDLPLDVHPHISPSEDQ